MDRARQSQPEVLAERPVGGGRDGALPVALLAIPARYGMATVHGRSAPHEPARQWAVGRCVGFSTLRWNGWLHCPVPAARTDGTASTAPRRITAGPSPVADALRDRIR